MKYRDPETGEFKELYAKAVDTLPVGTVVDYEGNEIPAGWEEAGASPGSCACFSKTDNQDIVSNERIPILFNKTDYVDNDCFELQSDGTIKVLKDMERVLVSCSIRSYNDTNFIAYMYSFENNNNVKVTVDNGFSHAMDVLNYKTLAFTGILKVKKNSYIAIDLFTNENNGRIAGYSKEWCGINLCVLK